MKIFAEPSCYFLILVLVFTDLTVLGAVAPKILRLPMDVASVDGKTVKMTCPVFGAPKPSVKWVRNGQVLIGERYEVLKTRELQIQDVSFSDAGEYTCIAANKFGSVNATGHLAVKEHTRIVDKPEDLEVAAGGTATFKCGVNTDSTLPLQLDWMKDGDSIDLEQESRLLLGNDNSLRITNTTELDSGTYTCVARTDLDEDRAQANLVVQDVPNPPTLLSVACGPEEATVTWAHAGDNRSPILYYSIQYNTSFSPDTWDDIEDPVPARDQTYAVALSPWANYTFRVIAWNKIGASAPSSQSSVCTTLPDVPYENPEDVECKEGNIPRRLIVNWTVMQKTQHHAPKFMYRVYYKRDVPEEEWAIENVQDWQTNKLRINNIPAYQRYIIKVEAVNKRGVALKVPYEVLCFSGENVSLQAPGDFTLEKVMSSTTALLSWTKVHEPVRGELRGYKIETWSEEDGIKALREFYINGADKTYALVNKFVPYSKNYVRIRAHNGSYDGPASKVISFETPEGVPGTVTRLDAYPVGFTALMLKWSKPIEINGILTGYKITFQSISGSENEPKMERRISDPKATSAKLSGLTPRAWYGITIRATTNAGEGEPYFVDKALPASNSPHKPTFRWYNYNIPKNSGLTNLRIIWDMEQVGYPGSHFFAKYRLVGETKDTETEPEMESNEIEISALESGRTYIVSIVAVDGPHYAESDPQHVDL